jgi:DNA-binding CsgD family transcriptional regulator
MLETALDVFGIGVVVCDRAGPIVFANSIARERGEHGALRIFGRQLSAISPAETKALMTLVRAAASGRRWGAISLKAPDGGPAVPILVTPLSPYPEGSGGHVLLALAERSHNPWITEATLGKLYHLSRTQGEIAIAIFNGQSPEDIASERGIKISTVRTHLTNIFMRTRAKTQRDLIRLIASLPPLSR